MVFLPFQKTGIVNKNMQWTINRFDPCSNNKIIKTKIVKKEMNLTVLLIQIPASEGFVEPLFGLTQVSFAAKSTEKMSYWNQ